MQKMTFIGKPDRVFPGLKTGKKYSINAEETREYSFLGIKFGKKFVLVTGDIECPYSSWSTFRKNWK